MAGRLDTRVNKLPLAIEFEGKKIIVRVPNWLAALRLRMQSLSLPARLMDALTREKFSLSVAIGSMAVIEVFPNRPWFGSAMFPALRNIG